MLIEKYNGYDILFNAITGKFECDLTPIDNIDRPRTIFDHPNIDVIKYKIDSVISVSIDFTCFDISDNSGNIYQVVGKNKYGSFLVKNKYGTIVDIDSDYVEDYYCIVNDTNRCTFEKMFEISEKILYLRREHSELIDKVKGCMRLSELK